MAKAPLTPRGGDGACLFLKSGSACRRLGSSEATQGGGGGGGPRRKEGRLLGPEAERELGKWCSSGDGRGLQAAGPARGSRGDRAGGGCSTAHAGPPAANFCGLRGGGSRYVGRRSPPLPGPHPAAACAAQPRRVCAATQLARGPPTQARPRLQSPPEPLHSRYQRLGDCGSLLLRAREKRGDRRDPLAARPGRRDERLASCGNLERASLLFSFSVLGAVSARGQTCGGEGAIALWRRRTRARAGEA